MFVIIFGNSLNNKDDKTNTYLKTDVDVCLSILEAGINIRVLINSVDMNGKFKLNATTNGILKIQRVDGSTLYDALELSFNTVGKTNILKVNNIDISTYLASKASSSNVYTKQAIHGFDIALASSLNNKADTSNS